MKRIAIAASIVAMLASAAPSHAGGAVRGWVKLPTASPFVAHSAWAAKFRANGLTGYIFRVNPSADDAVYTLTTTGGATGFENVDAYFYEDLPDGSGPGAICPVAVRQEGLRSESGVMCSGPQVAAWGIVVLTTGADATFGLTW